MLPLDNLIVKPVTRKCVPNSEAHRYMLREGVDFLERLHWDLIDMSDPRNEGYLDYCIRKRIVVLRPVPDQSVCCRDRPRS